ncbi:MAG: hypothetical protein HY901_01920 [Deltaproteobacteria bacterium]|nr:hypothetical protein [Deltaproteobacteria bacterium]
MTKHELGDVLSGVAAFHRLREKAGQRRLSMSEGQMLMRILECFEPIRVTESGVGREHRWIAFKAPASMREEGVAQEVELRGLSLYRATIAAAELPRVGERVELRLGASPQEWRFDADVVADHPQQGTVTVALRAFTGRGEVAWQPREMAPAA